MLDENFDVKTRFRLFLLGLIFLSAVSSLYRRTGKQYVLKARKLDFIGRLSDEQSAKFS